MAGQPTDGSSVGSQAEPARYGPGATVEVVVVDEAVGLVVVVVVVVELPPLLPTVVVLVVVEPVYPREPLDPEERELDEPESLVCAPTDRWVPGTWVEPFVSSTVF